MSAIQKEHISNIDIFTLKTPDHQEYFYCLAPQEEDTFSSMLVRLAEVIRKAGAQVISLEVFGGLGSGAVQREVVKEAFGDAAFPVTWVEEKSGAASKVTGIQAWAISNVPVLPIIFNGTVLGTYYDVPSGRYCRLGGVVPSDTALSRQEQSDAVFQRMDAALQLCDMQFTQVMRTWFFNHHLLDWYDAFNASRDAFFREKQMFQYVVPASTGIEGGNPASAALEAGALAIIPANEEVAVCAVPSPLQCAALEYGSTFSRAAEIREPGVRRLFISGTASISPDGESQFNGDAAAQIKRTMEVAEAILQSRGMDLSCTTRALTYFKHAEDIPLFDAWRRETNAPDIPTIRIHNDVCRDDLLFEIELDAISVEE